MALNCGANCVRVILVVLNTCFLAIGIGFLGVGVWLIADKSALEVLRFAVGIATTVELVWDVAVVFIIASVLVIAIAGIGFHGSLSANPGFLGCYSGILVILVILQAIGLVLTGVFYSKIKTKLANNLNETLQHRYGTEKYKVTTKGWNILQTEISCCGVKSPRDWSTSLWKRNQTSKNVPDQCCVLEKKDFNNPHPVDPEKCQEAAYNEHFENRDSFVSAKGCEQKIEEGMKRYLLIIISSVVGLFGLQAVIISMACCLRSSAKKGVAYERL